jgi:hypothetical protein
MTIERLAAASGAVVAGRQCHQRERETASCCKSLHEFLLECRALAESSGDDLRRGRVSTMVLLPSCCTDRPSRADRGGITLTLPTDMLGARVATSEQGEESFGDWTETPGPAGAAIAV